VLKVCLGSAGRVLRVIVFAWPDPVTGLAFFKSAVKSEPQAWTELDKLLEQPSGDREPESGVAIAKLWTNTNGAGRTSTTPQTAIFLASAELYTS
jgi:hypothetical protein